MIRIGQCAIHSMTASPFEAPLNARTSKARSIKIKTWDGLWSAGFHEKVNVWSGSLVRRIWNEELQHSQFVPGHRVLVHTSRPSRAPGRSRGRPASLEVEADPRVERRGREPGAVRFALGENLHAHPDGAAGQRSKTRRNWSRAGRSRTGRDRSGDPRHRGSTTDRWRFSRQRISSRAIDRRFVE